MESQTWVPFVVVFVIGVAVGYAIRAWMSARRRRKFG